MVVMLFVDSAQTLAILETTITSSLEKLTPLFFRFLLVDLIGSWINGYESRFRTGSSVICNQYQTADG